MVPCTILYPLSIRLGLYKNYQHRGGDSFLHISARDPSQLFYFSINFGTSMYLQTQHNQSWPRNSPTPPNVVDVLGMYCVRRTNDIEFQLSFHQCLSVGQADKKQEISQLGDPGVA